MTGDFTSTKVQDERLYFLEGRMMDFDKADTDKGQRMFKVCKNVFQFLLILTHVHSFLLSQSDKI